MPPVPGDDASGPVLANVTLRVGCCPAPLLLQSVLTQVVVTILPALGVLSAMNE